MTTAPKLLHSLKRPFSLLATSILIAAGIVSSPGSTASTSITQLGADIDGLSVDGETEFGYSVSTSEDGTVVAVGSPFFDVIPNKNEGRTSIYKWDGSSWNQLGSNLTGVNDSDNSGSSVSLSADGTRVAIGTRHGDGNGADSGHVEIYDWDGSSWNQVGTDITGESAGDESGWAVSLSGNGARVAIGAPYNDVGGNNAGHTRVFELDGGNWSQVGADIDGEFADDRSGYSVSLNSDGTKLAIGAPFNDVGGDSENAGHTRVFELDGGNWSQVGADIDGESAGDISGSSVSLNSDGTKLAIGSPENDVGGNSNNAGHTRVFELDGGNWSQVGADIDGESAGDRSGWSVSLSRDGTKVAVGANVAGPFNTGHVRVFSLPAPPEPPASPAPAPYSGPLISSVGSGNAFSAAGETVTINGQRLGSVTKVIIDGKEAELVSVTSESFQIIIPEGLDAGTYDIQIQSSLGNLTYLDGITITESKTVETTEYGEMTAWTKRISDNQAKVYVKFPTVGEKVRISHQTGGSGNYETVYVKTTSSETMDGLIIVEGVGTYIVRTIDLADINRIRVTVGDQTPVQVRYNK